MRLRTINKNNKLDDKLLFEIAMYISSIKYKLARAYSVETGFPIKYIISDLDSILNLTFDIRSYYDNIVSNILPSGRVILLPPKYIYAGSKYVKLSIKPYNSVFIVLPFNSVLPYAINLPLYAFLAGVYAVHIYLSRKTPVTNSYLKIIYDVIHKAGLNIYHVDVNPNDLINYAKKNDIDLIHYFGSSQYIPKILSEAFNYGINVIYEGEGFNIGVMFAQRFDNTYIDLILRSSLKYNGAVCSRIHTYLVADILYNDAVKAIKKELSKLNISDNPTTPFTDIGPISHALYNNYIFTVKKLRSQGAIIYGEPNCKHLSSNSGYLCNPLLIDINKLDYLPCKEINSPIILIKKVRNIEEIVNLVDKKKIFNLQVLGEDEAIINQIINQIQASRIVINNDPTIESPYLPWGSIGKHGNTGAIFWIEKYMHRNTIERTRWLNNQKFAYTIEVFSPYKLELKKKKIPEINDGFLVEVLASGVCGTDKALIRGEYDAPYPVIPGHENVGRVIKAPISSSNISEGDIIIWSANIPCGRCMYCRKGMDKYCPYIIEYGLTISSSTEPYLWGGWSTHAYVPFYSYIYKLKSNINPDIMVFAEPYACTYNIKYFVISQYNKKNDNCNILVVGSGSLAFLTLVRLHRLKLSEKVDINVHSLIKYRKLQDLFNKYSNKVYVLNEDNVEFCCYDIVIDTVGTDETIYKALLYAKPTATILILGGYNNKPIHIENKKLLFDKDIKMIFLGSYNRDMFLLSAAEFEKLSEVHEIIKDYIKVIELKYTNYNKNIDLINLILNYEKEIKRIIKIKS